VLLLLLTTVISLIEVNQLAYIDGAISHFRRLLAITAPYMPAETRLMYESRFAQIASSEDYVALERDLQGICHGKSLKCPSFSVW